MADWPETPIALPCAFNLGSFSRQRIKIYDEFQPDYGRPLRYRRYTGVTWDVSGEANMTKEQVDVLHEFYETTLDGGSGRFNMNNRMTWNEALVVMFRDVFTVQELTTKKFLVGLQFVMWSGN